MYDFVQLYSFFIGKRCSFNFLDDLLKHREIKKMDSKDSLGEFFLWKIFDIHLQKVRKILRILRCRVRSTNIHSKGHSSKHFGAFWETKLSGNQQKKENF